MTLSSPLFDLVPENERAATRARRSLSLAAHSWPEATQEMRARFPELAHRVLTDSDAVAEGFLFVVNGDLLTNGRTPSELDAADEIHVIAQMAGG